jgi:hypothetical protein
MYVRGVYILRYLFRIPTKIVRNKTAVRNVGMKVATMADIDVEPAARWPPAPGV